MEGQGEGGWHGGVVGHLRALEVASARVVVRTRDASSMRISALNPLSSPPSSTMSVSCGSCCPGSNWSTSRINVAASPSSSLRCRIIFNGVSVKAVLLNASAAKLGHETRLCSSEMMSANERDATYE